MDISQLRLGSFSELELRVMLESVLAIKRLKEEIQEEEKKRRKERSWTIRHNTELNRRVHSLHHTLMNSSEDDQNETYFSSSRISPELFQNLEERLTEANMVLETKQDIDMSRTPTEVQKRKIDVCHHSTANKKRKTQLQEFTSQQVDFVTDALAAITREKKQKSPVLEECEEFCHHFAYFMASLPDFESREELKRRIEMDYFKIKFPSRLVAEKESGVLNLLPKNK